MSTHHFRGVIGSGLGFFAALAACGGGGDLGGGEAFVGTYAVTLHNYNDGNATTVPCSEPGPDVVGGEAYIKVVVDEFFDDPNYLELETCATDPADCFYGFVSFEAHGDHLASEGASTQYGGGFACQLNAWQSYATLTGTTLQVQSRTWYANMDIPEGDCELDLAEALLGSPDCETVEVWDAERQ